MNQAWTSLLAAACALTGLLVHLPQPAQAQQPRVRVTVTDVVGARVFITPGRTSGLQDGNTVTIGGRAFEVVASTASFAVLQNGGAHLEVGAHGVAQVTPQEEEVIEARPAVQSLSTFRGQWGQAERPAASQDPVYIPLAGELGNRRISLAMTASTGVLVPLGEAGATLVRSQLQTRVHIEPAESVPLSIDADAAVQFYIARDIDTRAGDRSRPIVQVRQLELSYGEDRAFYAALGRLRYAASTVGVLDGARVRSPSWRGFSLGAFGGIVPDPEDGRPEVDASRFGLELQYQDAQSALRPFGSLVVHGSTFDGGLDERRISGAVRLYPGAWGIGAHFELSYLGEDNPWGAAPFELSAVGGNISSRHGAFRWSLRGDYRVPERSRWLAAHLPPGFLCVAERQASGGSETSPCIDGNDARYLGSVDAEYRWENVAVSTGGTFAQSPAADVYQLHGFARVRAIKLWEVYHADLTVAAAHNSLLDTYSLRLAAGGHLNDTLDASLHYRPAFRYYRAALEPWIDHMVGGSLYASWAPTWHVGLNIDALFGPDGKAFIGQLSVSWRPQIGSEGL